MVIGLIHNHADQHQNEVVLSFDQSLHSSFSLFLLPTSFHLNFEALVPRVTMPGESKNVGLKKKCMFCCTSREQNLYFLDYCKHLWSMSPERLETLRRQKTTRLIGKPRGPLRWPFYDLLKAESRIARVT